MNQEISTAYIITSLVASLIIFVIIMCFVLAYFFPNKRDYNCSDFSSRAQIELVYKRAGGPEKDPYHLDKNKDGVPCNGSTY